MQTSAKLSLVISNKQVTNRVLTELKMGGGMLDELPIAGIYAYGSIDP